MADEIVDFDAPNGQSDSAAQADVTFGKMASLNAKAVMPDGRTLGRGEILQALGLNPNTSPTAWLNIAGCGSNASALLPGDLQRVAAMRVANAASVLNKVQSLGSATSGFASGGVAPK